VQSIILQKVASGTFTLSYNGQTSAAITYSTTPATTAAAILSGPHRRAHQPCRRQRRHRYRGEQRRNNQLFQVTFQGALAGTPQPLMAINTTSCGVREHRARLRLDDDGGQRGVDDQPPARR